MCYFLLGVLVCWWILAAAVSVKADNMLAERNTRWSDIFPAIFCWPLIAVLICVSKHRVSSTYSNDDKYVY